MLGEILGTENLYDLSQVDSIEVKLGVSWSRQLEKAYVSFYSVYVNAEHFATINARADQKQIDLSMLNLQHAMFRDPVNDEESADTVGEALQSLVDEFIAQPKKTNEEAVVIPLQLRSGHGALPLFDQALPLVPSNDLLDDDNIDPNKKLTAEELKQAELRQTEKAAAEQRFVLLNGYLSRLIVGSGKLARDCLQQFLYLGPLRDIPRSALQSGAISRSG